MSCYLFFLVFCRVLADVEFRPFYFLFGTALVIAAYFLVLPDLFGYLSSLQFCGSSSGRCYSSRKRTLLYYGLPLLVFLCYYLSYYPGAFSFDSVRQLEQAVTNQYNDWHPVLQTLFAFKLPLFLSRGWVGSIVMFQILLFSAALGYCFTVLDCLAGMKYTIACMLFILLNPLTGNIAMFPWKDVSFAIGAVLLAVYALQIYFSRGMWLRKKRNFSAFAAVFVFTTLFRHNAVLFTVPLLAAVLLTLSPKRSLAMVLTVAACCFLIKYPLYSALHVEKPDRRQIETLGLPMTVIGAAVTYAPEKTDPDILEFAYRIAPKEIWEQSFVFGNYNKIKDNNQTNQNVIEEYGRAAVLRMAWRCMKNSPYICAVNLVKLTEGVFTITDPHTVSVSPYIYINSYEVESADLFPILKNMLSSWRLFVMEFFPHIFLYYGVAYLVLITSLLATCNLRSGPDWKKILFVAPLFCYSYGSSLLLTTKGDACRFFFCTVLLLPVLLVFFYRKVSEET